MNTDEAVEICKKFIVVQVHFVLPIIMFSMLLSLLVERNRLIDYISVHCKKSLVDSTYLFGFFLV